MSIIRRGDKNYYIGLNWRQLYMPKKLQAEVDELIKTSNLRSPFGVIRRPAKGSTVEAQVGYTDDAVTAGCFSGASVLANIIDRGLLVEKVEDGLYWIVLVLDHSVVPGCDKIFKTDSVEEKVREWIGLAGSEDVPIFMSDLSAEHLPMFEDYDAQDFFALVEAAEGDPHKRDARMGSLKKFPLGKILGMVVLLGGGAAAYWYMTADPAAQTDMASAFPAMSAVSEAVAIPTLTEEMRTAARKEEAGWLYQQSLFSPEFVLTALNQQFRTLPLSVAGWSMVSMKFDATNPGTAVVTYRRERLGAPYGLVHAIPLEWSFTELADTAEATLILASPVGEADVDVIALVNSSENRWLDFIDAVQSRGLSVGVGEAMESDRPTPIIGLPDSVPEAFKRQLSVRQRNFTATGSGWLSANAFSSAVQPLSFIAVKTVDISLGDSGLNWIMNGEVYEHAE